MILPNITYHLSVSLGELLSYSYEIEKLHIKAPRTVHNIPNNKIAKSRLQNGRSKSFRKLQTNFFAAKFLKNFFENVMCNR